MPAKKRTNAITNYWLKHYVDEKTTLCALCANKGHIDINTHSPAGVLVKGPQFCICPNGQAMRHNAVTLFPDWPKEKHRKMTKTSNEKCRNGTCDCF